MNATYGFVSVLPPLLTITLALTSKRVLPSLFAGVLASHVVLTWPEPWRAPFAAMDQMIVTSTDRGNFLLILFSLMVGGVLQLIRDGRGFEAFADLFVRRSSGKRTTYLLTVTIAASMFLDTWSNVLINGATNGPLYDRLGIARQRLAYYAHCVAISIVAMVVLNGWGAFYLALLSAQNVDQPFSFIVGSIPYMAYNWINLAVTLLVMVTGLAIGPMRRFDKAAIGTRPSVAKTSEAHDATAPKPRVIYMMAPLLTLVVSVFVGLHITGKGNVLAGDAALSITYGVMLASAVIAGLLLYFRVAGPVAIEESYVAGMAKFFDVGIMMVLALSIGDLTRTLGTGPYLALLAQGSLPSFALPALVFLLGAVMSFATGTSYGTYSIMVPIALPLAFASGLDPHLMFGAVISGGLFGDNSSPISDTSIMTSLATEVPVVEHVSTQLPYTLLAAFLSLIAFLILGVLA